MLLIPKSKKGNQEIRVTSGLNIYLFKNRPVMIKRLKPHSSILFFLEGLFKFRKLDEKEKASSNLIS